MGGNGGEMGGNEEILCTTPDACGHHAQQRVGTEGTELKGLLQVNNEWRN